MMKFRKLLESVVYVGMRPGAAPLPLRVAKLFGPFRGRVERFLTNGLSPTDPLYLTNRTFGQKLRLAVVVAVPCLILVGIVAIGVGSYVRVNEKPQVQMSNAELAAKLLPDLAKVNITTNHDLEVVESRVEIGRSVFGTVRNNTNHAIDNAEVIFDLTTNSGARLGAVSAKIAHVAPNSTAPFSVTFEQNTAYYALVREVILP